MRLKEEVYDVLIDAVNNGIEDDAKFDFAVRDSAKIIKLICDFCEKNGDIALQCGSEWMYQSDKGQEDGLELVGNILDKLESYAEPEELDEED